MPPGKPTDPRFYVQLNQKRFHFRRGGTMKWFPLQFSMPKATFIESAIYISSSSAPGKIGPPRPKLEKDSQKLRYFPIAPKFGTKEVKRQSP